MVNLRSEKALLKKGFRRVAGVDEAGRGPLAGPVVASAVVLQKNIKDLDDSKKLSSAQRENIYRIILKEAEDIGIGIVSEAVIDRTNILKASLLAMKKAVAGLDKAPDFILVDGNKTIPGIGVRQKAVTGGDGICASIAAASVVAKVTRDRLMKEMHLKYPKYSFDAHKGYGTKSHLEALKKFGACPAHRKSFAPVSIAMKKVIEY
jgi:ribonuclease HII